MVSINKHIIEKKLLIDHGDYYSINVTINLVLSRSRRKTYNKTVFKIQKMLRPFPIKHMYILTESYLG